MPFEDVYLVNDRLKRVPEREIDALERHLGFPLPLGYREYMSTLGLGRFCHKLEVLRPSEVRRELKHWRTKYLPQVDPKEFWSSGCLFSPDEWAETVVFAKTVEGDNFVACASKGRVVIELPRHADKMRLLRKGFLKPFECCPYSKRFRFPFFEPETKSNRDVYIRLRRDEDAAEVWRLAKKQWGRGLRVADHDARTGAPENSFIRSIQGCLRQEEPRRFWLQFDRSRQREAQGFVEKLRHLMAE